MSLIRDSLRQVVSAVVLVVNIVTEFFLFFARIIRFLVLRLIDLLQFLLQLILSPAVILVVLFALAWFLLGPVLLEDVTPFIEAVSVVWECYLSPLREAYTKVIAFNAQVAFIFFVEVWNNTMTLLIQVIYLYIDIFVEAVDCFTTSGVFGGIISLLAIPAKLWLGTEPLLFVFHVPNNFAYQREAMSRFYPTQLQTSYLPYEDVLNGIPGAFKPNIDPTYGAQTTFPLPAPQTLRFHIRMFANLVNDYTAGIYRLGTQIVSDLRSPGGLFVPNLYADPVVSATSYTGQAADTLCRVVELVTFTPFWPSDALGRQPSRDTFVSAYCPIIRKAACVASSVLLISVLATTANPPTPLLADDQCLSADFSAGDAFLGVPFIDLVLNNPRNLRIFSTSRTFCEFGREAGLVAAQMCGGFAQDSVAPVCNVWNGVGAITANEKVDVFARLVDCVVDTLLMPIGLIPVVGATIQNVVSAVSGVFAGLLDQFTFGLLYVVNALIASCPVQSAILSFIGRFATIIVGLLEDLFNRDCATYAEAGFENDLLVCVVVLTSAELGGFFRNICETLNPAGVLGTFLSVGIDMCARRKRSVGAREWSNGHIGNTTNVSPLPTYYTVMGQYQLMRGASEVRSTFRAARACISHPGNSTLANCSDGCSLLPCMGQTLDCIAQNLPPTHRFRESIGSTSSWTRSALIFSSTGFDMLRGCKDAPLPVVGNSISLALRMLRRWVLQADFVVHGVADAYKRCAKAHIEDIDSEAFTRVQLTRRFTDCLGLERASDTAAVQVDETDDTEAAALQEWQLTWSANGIDAVSTDCGEVLHRHGLVADRMRGTVSVASDHFAYRVCMTSLSGGAFAISHGATHRALLEYANPATALGAMLDSASEIESDAATFDHRLPSGLRELDLAANSINRTVGALYSHATVGQVSPLTLASRIFEWTDASNAKGADPEAARVIRSTHYAASVAYAYGSYMADVFDDILANDSPHATHDPFEMEQQSTAMLKDVIKVIVTRDTHAAHAADELAKDLHEHRKRSVGAGDLPADSLMRAAVVFGNSLRWVDEMRGRANSASERDVRRQRAASAGEQALCSHLETNLHIEPRVNSYTMGIRVLDSYDANAVGAPLLDMQRNTSSSDADYLWSADHMDESIVLRPGASSVMFAPLELDRVDRAMRALVAIRYTRRDFARSQTGADDNLHLEDGGIQLSPRERQWAANAVRHREAIDILIQSVLDRSSVARTVAERIVSYQRALIHSAWNIIDRRVRFKSLSPVQSAHVFVDILTGGAPDDFENWMRGTQGYIVGVGYVSRSAYEFYMHDEDARRLSYSSGFSPMNSLQGEERFFLRPARAQYRALIESERQAQTARRVGNLLGAGDANSTLSQTTGFGALDRLLRMQRTSVNFRARTRFLRLHNLHHEDAMLGHAAPHHWQHRSAALHAENNHTHRVQLAALAAPVGDASLFVCVLDDLIGLFGGGTTAFADFLASGDATSLQVFTFTFQSLFTTIETQYESFLMMQTCVGPANYRRDRTLAGGGIAPLPYVLGCLPFLPEADPIGDCIYPQQTTGNGVLNVFCGPGFIQFPDEMLLVDCPQRIAPPPVPQCSLWDTPLTFFTDELEFSDITCQVTDVGRPLCPFCNYCERRWKTPAQMGLVTGFDTLAVWDGIARYLIETPFLSCDTLAVIVVTLVVFAPPIVQYIPFGPLVYVIALLLLLFVDFFVSQTPERYAFTSIGLLIVSFVSQPLGLILYTLYAIGQGNMCLLGEPDVPELLRTIIDFVSCNLLIGPLFRTYFSVIADLPYSTTLQTLPIVGSLLDPTVYAIADAQFAVSKLVPPTQAQVIYGIFSFKLALDLLLSFVPLLFLLFLLLVILVELLRALLNILLAIRRYFVSLRLVRIRNSVRTLRTDLDDSLRRVSSRLSGDIEDVEFANFNRQRENQEPLGDRNLENIRGGRIARKLIDSVTKRGPV